MAVIKIGRALDIAKQYNIPKRGYYLRWDEKDYVPGDVLPPSRQWRNGEPTSKVLAGTSALDPKAEFSQHDREFVGYFGHLYLVKGRVIRRGQDRGEVILGDVVVVAKLAGR